MYRAVDLRGVDTDMGGNTESTWLTLEPGIMSNIAKQLSRGDAGALRLTCKTWKQAVSLGVQTMAIVSL